MATAFTGGLAVAALSSALTLSTGVGIAVVVLLVVACSFRAGAVTVSGVALLSWLFLTGVVVHHTGVLAFSGLADADRLGTLLGAGLLAALLTRRAQWLPARFSPTTPATISPRHNIWTSDSRSSRNSTLTTATMAVPAPDHTA